MNNIIGDQQVTDTELGWLAGIIDGEGYLGMTFQNQKRNILTVKPEICVVNTDTLLVDKYADILQRMGVSYYIRTRKYKSKTWRTAYHITVCRFTSIIKLLTRVTTSLVGIKQTKAEVMLEFATYRLTKGRRQYDATSKSLIKTFHELVSGTSETTRETPMLKWVKI